MTDTVVSKFRAGFPQKILIAAGLIILAALRLILYTFNLYYWKLTPQSCLIIIGFILLAIVLPLIISYKFVVRVTAGADGLEFYHFLNGRRKIIRYEDIVHVTNLLVNAASASPDGKYSGDRLVIELKSGKLISFWEFQFINYNELKESIRRHRFHLD